MTHRRSPRAGPLARSHRSPRPARPERLRLAEPEPDYEIIFEVELEPTRH